VNRVIGAVAAIAVACAAFLAGQAIAGGAEKSSDAKPRPVAQASGSVPQVLRQAEDAVVLPVLAVRRLPSLAAPHRKLIKPTPTPTQTQTPAIQTPLQQNVNPNPPVKQPQQNTPRRNSGNGGGGGGSGGYFDDSG
jgi:hypothetical protein